MGYLLQAQRKFDEAEPYWQESLDRRRRVLGEAHPDTLNSLNNMGSLRQQQGRPAEAEPFWLEALKKRRQLLGPEHPDTLWSMNNLGGLYLITGRPEEAQDLLTGATRAGGGSSQSSGARSCC